MKIYTEPNNYKIIMVQDNYQKQQLKKNVFLSQICSRTFYLSIVKHTLLKTS